jgi:hypothetical protein
MLCNALGNGVALFLVWLFAIAGAHKLRSPAYYQRSVASYCGVARGGKLLVLTLALGELSLAMLLLIPAARIAGFAGGAIVLLVYAGLMWRQYKRVGGNLACGCAGPASALAVGPALVIRNLVCAGAALLAMAPARGLTDSLANAVLALIAAVLMIAVYLCSDQLIASAQAMNEDI